MPKNTRQHYKREIERAIGNIEWAIKHLSQVNEAYKEHHDHISNGAEMIMITLAHTQDACDKLNKEI